MQIHPYLIARLYAIKAAFNEQWAINHASINNAPASKQSPAFNWDEFLNKTGDKSGGDGESGGGTMKGFKKSNKDPAQSMRRLGRS